MIGIGTIFRRRTGSGGPLPPNYAKWVREHMVFWYDMSKPVDTYAENFNDWTKYAGTKCTVTNKSVNITNFNNINRPSIYIDTSKKFNGITITVDGLLDGQEIAWGYINNPLVRMPKNGTYILEPINSLTETIGFRSINIVGACNITITQLPSGQSVPTNEILKANPYLQDFSGNNRQLKLNNFLFAAMSGVGGYEINWADTTIWANFLGSRFEGKIESSKLTITSALVSSGVMETKVPSFSIGYKVRVTGITDESLVYGYTNEAGQSLAINITKDGEYELPSNNVVEATYNMRWRVVAASYPHTCNITIEQIPAYPNALVTDGVDDYGQVQNLQQGVKMLFMTANPLMLYRTWYAQDSFSIYGQPNIIAYNSKNTGGVTYLDGMLNETEISNNLLNKKKTVTIVNPTNGSDNNVIFFNSYGSSYMQMAFYNSIGFDSVPTKETDGFTEQELIDYVLKNLITQ